MVTGRLLPRRQIAVDGRSWPSGLGSGRRQALEVEHDMGNSSRHYRRRDGARVGDPHDEGGSGRRVMPASGVPGTRGI
jgi:hypothetical protein